MSDNFQIDMSEVMAVAAALDIRSTEVAAKAAVAVKAAAETTKAEAQGHAPVLTGNLRDSIRISGSRLTRNVKARAPYSFYVEFGTTTQAPQPYLYPASDVGEAQLLLSLGAIASEDL